MMKCKILMATAMAGALVGVSALNVAQEASTEKPAKAPFGEQQDVDYADMLWQALKEADLAGDNAILAVPYEGQHPHGAVLQTLSHDLKVEDHTGAVIVKRNYGGEGVSKEKVANNPDQYLGAVTVMYQRETDYDPDNNNWFWAKYKPDGSLDQSPEGTPLAGRVAGCINCHSSASGGDLVFNNDRYAQ